MLLPGHVEILQQALVEAAGAEGLHTWLSERAQTSAGVRVARGAHDLAAALLLSRDHSAARARRPPGARTRFVELAGLLLSHAGREDDARELRARGAPLFVGLQYPDVPCASRTVRDGRVVMMDYKTCSWVRLSELLRSTDSRESELYSEAFLSHKSLLAYAHAMSHNPHLTAAEVADSVLAHASVCASLAVRDTTAAAGGAPPNAFWLGRLLHLVQDAYSPAHTLRAPRASEDADRLVRVLRAIADARVVASAVSDVSKETIVALVDRAARKAVARGVARLTERAPLQLVRSELAAHGIDPRAAESSTPRAQRYTRNLFLACYLEHAQRAALATAAARPPRRRRGGSAEGLRRDLGALRAHAAASAPPCPPLLTFHCFASQDPAAHLLADRMTAIERAALLRPAVADCAALLRMYRRACAALRACDPADAPACHDVFIREVRAFLQARTLRMHSPACAGLLTGYDVDAVRRELLA